MWLSASDQPLLPESLELAYDDSSAAHVASHRDMDTLNTAGIFETVNPQPDEENLLCCSDAVSSWPDVSNSKEYVLREPDCFECSDTVSTVVLPVNTDDCRTATEHDLLYEQLCRQINSIEDRDIVTHLSDRLRCLLKFFSAECLTDNATAFPFYILENYTNIISEESDWKEDSNCDNSV